jgi:hypothetical protein
MNQITRDRNSFLRWCRGQSVATAKPTDESIVQHNGVNYKILPLAEFEAMAQRWSPFDIGCFTFGAAMVAFCFGYTVSLGKPPTVVERIVTVEKPIMIDKPVPVNSGCLAFCNR